MAIITPEELVGQISASRQPLGQMRTIDSLDGGISTSGKIIGTKVGCKGEQGEAATIEIGTVSTVSSTTPASVVNVGTPTHAIFDFEIPKGADGGGGGGGTWGSITGTLSDQTDLQSALNDKISKSSTDGLVKNDGTIDTTSYSTFSGNYSDLSGKPTIPTVNDKKITIQINGTDVDYFKTNNSANKTINITVPTSTSDLVNDSGFITNAVNNLINYFKKADGTLPVYFVNASEHSTSGTAFNLTDKPVGLYLFLPNGTTPFDLYITPRTGANTNSFLSNLFLAIHIENVLPSVYVSNQLNYAYALLDDGKYRTYELSDEGTEIAPTWLTTQFITAGENNTITGELTFSTLPKSSTTPTNNDHLTRKGYVDNQAIKQDLITAGLTDYSSSSTYSVGDYVSYNNLIYKCNTAISTPEVWDSTKWTNKTYLEYLAELIYEPQYCHATSSGEQVPISNYYVQLSVFDRKNGNFTFENGGIRIGEGIHTIAVSGNIFVDGWNGGGTGYYVWGRIYKNNSLINGTINSGGAPFISCSMPSVIIQVSEGDVIKLMADNSAVNTTGTKIRNGGQNTYLDIFVIN